MCSTRRCSGRPTSFNASRLACTLTSGETNHIPAMPRRTSASSTTGSTSRIALSAKAFPSSTRPAACSDIAACTTSGPRRGCLSGASSRARRLRSALAPGSVVANASEANSSVLIATSSPAARWRRAEQRLRLAKRPGQASRQWLADRVPGGPKAHTRREPLRGSDHVESTAGLRAPARSPLRSAARSRSVTKPGGDRASPTARRRKTSVPVNRRPWRPDAPIPTCGPAALACSRGSGREACNRSLSRARNRRGQAPRVGDPRAARRAGMGCRRPPRPCGRASDRAQPASRRSRPAPPQLRRAARAQAVVHPRQPDIRRHSEAAPGPDPGASR